jgi:hypothetical protein
MTVRFLLTIIRFAANAEEQVERPYAFVDGHRDLWVGVNIAGREDNDNGHPLRFLETFRKMRRTYSGIQLSIHGGEVDSPGQDVRRTLMLGADTGDEPGEFQYWVEREKLDRVYPFPQGYHDLRMNRRGVLGVATGIGTAKAAATIMALGLDPRFDLSKAYWVVTGSSSIDPADGSLGSAAWAEWVVDGDLAHEIDSREIPSDWKAGYVPLRKSIRYEAPRRVPDEGEC